MTQLTKELTNKIEETHDTVLELKTVLLGKNGDDGLCGDVKRVNKRLSIVEWTVGILIGSGVLTGIGAAIINSIK